MRERERERPISTKASVAVEIEFGCGVDCTEYGPGNSRWPEAE